MKIISLFKKAKVLIKWGGVVMAIIKAIEVLMSELENLEKDKNV